jgi:hypothetical protein
MVASNFCKEVSKALIGKKKQTISHSKGSGIYTTFNKCNDVSFFSSRALKWSEPLFSYFNFTFQILIEIFIEESSNFTSMVVFSLSPPSYKTHIFNPSKQTHESRYCDWRLSSSHTLKEFASMIIWWRDQWQQSWIHKTSMDSIGYLAMLNLISFYNSNNIVTTCTYIGVVLPCKWMII